MTTPATMVDFLKNAVSTLITLVMNVWSSIVTNSSVLPYFIIGIGVSVLLVAIKVIKSVVWGS